MNFTALNHEGIPLWFLLWQGKKWKTRRPPPCLHCRKKWWEHSPPAMFDTINGKPLRMICPGSLGLTYEPDLSAWQPKEVAPLCKCGHLSKHHELCGGDEPVRMKCSDCDCQVYRFTGEVGEAQKELAICPGEGKAAICRHCGGWEEFHTHDIKNVEWMEKAWAQVGDGEERAVEIPAHNMRLMLTRDKDYFLLKDGIKHVVCNHYEPFRLKVVNVEMESEWLKQLDKDIDMYHLRSPEIPLDEHLRANRNNEEYTKAHAFMKSHELDKEARAEGYETWQQLQDVLFIREPAGSRPSNPAGLKEPKGLYPVGCPLAIIEFERKVMK